MDIFVQLTIAGLSNGAILALAALGFVLIYKASGVINFAQGQFLMVGAYVLWAAIAHWGLPWEIAIGVAVVAATALGLLVERVVLRPLVGQPVISVIMITIGLATVLDGIVLWVWGPSSSVFPSFIPSGNVDVLGSQISQNRLWAIGLVAIALVAFVLLLQRSRYGIAMRAVADDPQAALTMGISVNRVVALAWALAGVTAVAGGMLVANLTGVSLDLKNFGLLVFPVVILGGLDSVPGVVVGGAAIGLLQQYSGFYLDEHLARINIAGSAELVPYVALVLVLLVKPYGLFGQARIERV